MFSAALGQILTIGLTWSSVFQWNIFFSIFCPVCLGKKVTQGFDDHLTHNSFEAEIAEQEPVKVN